LVAGLKIDCPIDRESRAMTAPRKQPNLTIKLAAALCALTGPDGQRLIPHEHAKLMSADHVLSLFQWNHFPIPHAEGGPAEHWNLDPELIAAHRKVTAKIDVPGIAKRKRVRAAEAGHKTRMTVKIFGKDGIIGGADAIYNNIPVRSVRKIPSRGFPKGHRPMQSRNNLRRAKP
jgi:hypothetical protein